MSSQVSPSKPKFLLDENVKKRLLIFLTSSGFDAVFAPKGTRNGKLAGLSISEKMVLVSNDSDFSNQNVFTKEKLFSLIWLTVPQDDTRTLFDSISKLLSEKKYSSDFEGKMIILSGTKFEIKPLPDKKKIL